MEKLAETTTRIEVKVTVPGRIPIEIRLPLKGTQRVLEELFLSLAQAGRSEEIEVSGGSCCWNFTEDGSVVHMLVEAKGK